MNDGRRKGFTLVETLAGSVILAGAVAAVCMLNTRSISRVRLNQEYEQAWQILDQQLTYLSRMGIDEFLAMNETDGECLQYQDDSGEAKYFWHAEVEQQLDDNLYELTITIRWIYRNKAREISAATMFNGSGTPMVEEGLGVKNHRRRTPEEVPPKKNHRGGTPEQVRGLI